MSLLCLCLSIVCMCCVCFFFSSRRRHTRCALVTGVQTCALPISGGSESAADALAVEAAVLELDNRIESARADVEAAQVGLTRWIGSLALQVTADMPDFNVLPVPTARLLGALDRLGPLLATQAQVETAAAATDLAQAAKRPDWSVASSYGTRRHGR